MKKIILHALLLTLMNNGFMMLLLVLNSNEKFGSLLHQMLVFFSLILFFANVLVLFLANKFDAFFYFLSGRDVFFSSILLYIIALILSMNIQTSNDLLINLLFASSFFISLTSFFAVRKQKKLQPKKL